LEVYGVDNEKGRGRYKYINDYENYEELCNDGKLRKRVKYVGPYYVTESSGQELTRLKINVIICVIVQFLAIVLMLMDVDFAYYVHEWLYVAIPLTACAIPLVYALLGAIRLPSSSAKLQRDYHKRSFVRIRSSEIGVLVITGTALLLYVAFVCIRGFQVLSAADIVFFAAFAVHIALGFYVLNSISKIKYTIEER